MTMFFLENIEDLENAINDASDPRVRNWLLMESPWTVVMIVVAYLLLVLYALPGFMAARKAYTLRAPILLINVCQLAVNMWIVNEMYQAGWGTHYKLKCQPVDFSMRPDAVRMAGAVWLYLLTKVFDLLDTAIFVLRKKVNQVSYLHLYHHVSTLCFTWFVVKFAAGGTGTGAMLVNCCIHVLMYTYYLLSALGPQVQKYLWWKKYLTTLQMIQFFGILALNMSALIVDCGYNRVLMYVFIPLIAFNVVLFLNFYRKTYSRPHARTEKCD